MPSLRVLVTSVRSSSITRRMPPAAIRATRSPVCVYGELSWSAPSSGVDEEPRHVDVCRVDGGEVVDQRVPEVGVGAVRLVGQLAQLGVALALGHRDRVGGRLAGARGLLLLRDCRGLGLRGRRGCA